MDGFQFEGRQANVTALARQYPALTRGRWQTVLERGCKTLADALDESSRMDYARDASRVAAGRKAASNSATRVSIVPRSGEWA